MKSIHTIYAVSLLIFASCNNTKNMNDNAEVSAKMNEPLTCYSYEKDSNKIWMQISITDNLVTGDLVFDFYEKDKNIGKIKGEMKGDTLFAIYTFMSEGINSEREVAFLKNRGEWTEGFGDIMEQSGKTVFKDKSSLQFQNDMLLKQVKCEEKSH